MEAPMSNSLSVWSSCFLALALAANPLSGHAVEPERILIVVSGEGRDQGKTRPGFEMDEFAQAYLIFRDNGFAIDVASPQGGKVEADKYNPNEAFNANLLKDGEALRKLADTRTTADVRAADYAAVYVVGGKGAMFDLPVDPALKTLLADIHDQGGIVAAVCHGPAALVDVRLDDGSLLVADKALTGFSNEEEAVFGKRWAKEFRFPLEDAMRERGARWEEAPLMMPKLVVDDRLITGQNPYSTPSVAEAIVKAIGRVPVAREAWRDEATMALVQRLIAGQRDAVEAELAAHREHFHVELIGLLGYYQLQAAANDAAIANALAIMELAEPYMPEPQLQLGLADAHWRLGHRARARALIDKLLETSPDMKEARELQVRMNG
jgi:putative intracellular protease/amidase